MGSSTNRSLYELPIKRAVTSGFMPTRRSAEVLSSQQLCDGVYSLIIRDKYLAQGSAGQFANLYMHEETHLLPRPFGIARVGEIDDDSVEFIYAVVGSGTREFSRLTKGDTVDVLGPLGTGYDTDSDDHYLLIGGGLGIPPLIRAAQQISTHRSKVSTALLGYRDIHFADEKMGEFATRVLSIDDAEGTVIDLLDQWINNTDHTQIKNTNSHYKILSCGPHPMMEAVAHWAMDHHIEAQFSLEERMGCGFGTCVACVTPTVYGLKKICIDGPVFEGSELKW